MIICDDRYSKRSNIKVERLVDQIFCTAKCTEAG
jgi:hypothetical protein